MSHDQGSAAVSAARAYLDAWDRHDVDAVRAALADDVLMTMVPADPAFPKVELHGIDAYLEGLLPSKDAVVPGSVEVVDAIGDDRQALLTVRTRVRFGADAPELAATSARMYVFDDEGKLAVEHVLFFLTPSLGPR